MLSKSKSLSLPKKHDELKKRVHCKLFGLIDYFPSNAERLLFRLCTTRNNDI